VQGGPRKDVIRLQLGFAGDEFSYAIDFGLPEPSGSAFAHDPQIKRETIWHGPVWRRGTTLVNRSGAVVTAVGSGKEARSLARGLAPHECMLAELADPVRAPEVLAVRESVRGWRFYDHFRTDSHAPARQAHTVVRLP
jgi:predicted ATPase